MQMQDIERAVETLRAMAAIPCLRGGYVSFDAGDSLRAVGWSDEDGECYGNDSIVCVEVPVSAEIPECREAFKGAIAEARALAIGALDRRIPADLQPSHQRELEMGCIGDRPVFRRRLEYLAFDDVAISAEQEIQEAGARLDRVLPSCGWDEEFILRYREMLSDEAMAEWVRLLTDDELRRFMELAASDDDELAVA